MYLLINEDEFKILSHKKFRLQIEKKRPKLLDFCLKKFRNNKMHVNNYIGFVKCSHLVIVGHCKKQQLIEDKLLVVSNKEHFFRQQGEGFR